MLYPRLCDSEVSISQTILIYFPWLGLVVRVCCILMISCYKRNLKTSSLSMHNEEKYTQLFETSGFEKVIGNSLVDTIYVELISACDGTDIL